MEYHFNYYNGNNPHTQLDMEYTKGIITTS